MTEAPRAKTAEEVREEFLDEIRYNVRYWAERDGTPLERCEGLAFSILAILDGVADLPPFNIVVNVDPGDKELRQAEGENWYEDGQIINEVPLHELFYRR